jgi:lambda family phage tail tape measure protein
MATKQVREIIIHVDTKGSQGIKNIADNMAKMNKSIKDGTSVLQRFEKAWMAVAGLSFAGIGISSITNAMDAYQKLSDRIKVFEGSQEKANATMLNLAGVADRTRTSINDIATVYSRLALSLNESGLKSESLLFVTEQLQNSFRLSGSTTAEATAATIQLSQGLASGTLRGQELRSVLEANALIGQMLSEALGKPRAELMKLAEAGKITSRVFLDALSRGATKINQDVSKLGITFQEAADRGINKFTIAMGELNKSLGLSLMFDKAIQALVNNLSALAAVAAGLAVSSLPLLTKQLASLAPYFITPLSAIGALTASIAALVSLVTFSILEPDLFNKIGLQLRQGFIIAFADLSYLIWDVVKGFSLVASFGRGDFLTDLADKGRQSALGLKEEALKDIKEIEDAYNKIKAGEEAVKNIGVKTFEQQLADFKKALEKLQGKENSIFKFKDAVKLLNQEFLKTGDVSKYNTELRKLQIADLDNDFKNNGITLDEYNKRLKEINFGKPRKSLDEFRLDLSKLNADLKSKKITLGQYADALEGANLDKLNRDMKNGRANAIDTLEAMNAHKINEWRRSLYEGNVTLKEFRTGTQAEALDLLNKKFEAGKIDVYEYHKQVTEISDKFSTKSTLFTGINDYITSVGTISQNIAGAITNTFKALEDSFMDFIKTGKFNFEDFTQSVLDDLNRIIVRSLIIRPLAQGLLSYLPVNDMSGGSTGYSQDYLNGNTGGYAKGGAFDGGVQFFAQGGVVNGRTSFDLAGGRKGIMGEAGPEAIVPLARNKNGDLGVVSAGGSSNVTVNIINNGDSNVEQTERQGAGGERILDVIITQKVKEGLASGLFDRQMSQNYGIRRRGI